MSDLEIVEAPVTVPEQSTTGFNSDDISKEFREKLLEFLAQYGVTDFWGVFDNVTDDNFAGVIVHNTQSADFLLNSSLFVLIEMLGMDKDLINNAIAESIKKQNASTEENK
jgi:hypothetical protein